MTQTIEEVKRVCKQCGMRFEKAGDGTVVIALLDELQAFAQHYIEEQREKDHVLYMKILKIALRDMEAIRNNTGE